LAALEISHLSSGYGSDVIQKLSLTVSSPSLFAVLGKNGSGKSTLIKCIAQQQSYSGSIKWNNENLADLKVSDRASRLSYLHQRNNISINLKVSELIVMGRFRTKSLLENYRSHDYELVDFWLEKLKIIDLRDKYVNEISGGEQQLVWICQTLIQDTPLILFDEPSSQLDLMNKKKLFNLIRDLAENDKTIILITHDIDYLTTMNGSLINLSDNDKSIKKITESEMKYQRGLLEAF
jgi:iron complex transport system ATP-binding protein